MNRKVLKISVDLDFELIALTTSLKDYRACYLINKHLNFNFVKGNDLEVDIYQNSTEPVYFSLYHDECESTETHFYFVANRGTDGLLIPELRQTNYFLMIKNYIDENELDIILAGLNALPEITLAIKIEPKKIKSIENLLF